MEDLEQNDGSLEVKNKPKKYVPSEIERMFDEEVELIHENLSRSDDIYKMLKSDLDKMYAPTNTIGGSSSGKATSMENMISLLANRDSQFKTLVAIKKTKIDLAKKVETLSGSEETGDVLKTIMSMLKGGGNSQDPTKIAMADDSESDEDIDALLDGRLAK